MAGNHHRKHQILFVIAAMTFIMLGVSGGLLNIAWTYMKDTFNVEVGMLGVLLLFATSGSLLAASGSGTLIGKIGLGRSTVGAVLVLALGLAAIASVQIWALALIAILVMYMGRGLLDAAMNNFVSENYGTTAMNWLHASWGIGLTIAPTIMTVILVTWALPWQAGYWLMAGVALIVAVIIVLSLRWWDALSDDDSDENIAQKIQRASVSETIQQPVILLGMLLFFVYGGVEIGTGQLANTLLVEGRGFPQETASLWLSFYWGSFTAGRIAMGWIALRVRDTRLLRGGMSMALLGAILLTWNPAPIFSLIGLMLIGIGLAGIFPILISRTPERVGRRFSAQAIGFQIGFAGLGAAFMPGVISLVADRFGLEWISIGIAINALLLIVLYEATARYSRRTTLV